VTAINTRAAHAAAVARLTSLNRAADMAQEQIATGKRVTAPADDPIAFTRASVLRRADTAALATQRGIDAASRRLNATDTALAGISDIVQRARELALQGSNGTLSASDRGVLATEVSELLAAATGLADTRSSDGERLFGGAASAVPAYAADADGVLQWQGAGRAPAVVIDGASVSGGIEGPDAFGITTSTVTGAPPVTTITSRDLFATLSALVGALAEPDKTLRNTAMSAALGEIDGHITRLGTARATAGARLGRLESETERIARTSLAIQTDLTKLESLDLTEGIARLQRLLTVVRAAQASFVQTSNLSLWDQLR
jgi:flagellar hook-associated protein 3 FlgL